jgi:hypothetical protein
MHPEERRIAGLLRELIVQSGTTLDQIEKHLGWTTGHLDGLLEGRDRLSFEDVLEVLPLMNTTPADFFAWLYGFDPKNPGILPAESPATEPRLAGSSLQRVTDRRFEQSLRVVKEAISRRSAWKQERIEAPLERDED